MTLMSLLAVTLLVVPILAQSGRVREHKDPSDDQNDAVRLHVEEVLLPVSVRTSSGKLPGRLDRSDFIVVEDGKRQVINSVLRTPANVLFILDAGGESVLKNLNLHRELALKMIDSLGPDDRAAVITYGDRVSLIGGWTKDKRALRAALNWKFRPGLASELYAGLIYAADQVLPRVNGRRSVVVITDGVDSYDDQSFERALTELHRARATVYVASQSSILLAKLKPEAFNIFSAFEMLDPRARGRIERLRWYYRELEAGAVTFKGLAEETGGAAWYPATVDEFESLDSKLISEINMECVIAYQSQRPIDDEKFHSVRVTSTRPDLRIRFRRGVYSGVRSRHEGGAASSTDGRGEGAAWNRGESFSPRS
jgi:VWFA-related protein